MKKMLLVRGQSELSKKAEKFLQDNKIRYDIFYADERDTLNLPVIFTPLCSFPYQGEKGFNLFKETYQKSV